MNDHLRPTVLRSLTARSAAQGALQRCFDQQHRRVYADNATIISAGEHSSSLFYIVRGSVSVIVEDDDGHEMLLAYLNEDDFFGEIGMFDEHHQRSAWVRARGECEVVQISYERIKELCDDDPDVLFVMLTVTSLRIRDTSRKLGDLAFMDVAGRIARALLELSKQPQARQRSDGIAIDITRMELGRIVGCSREMVSRVIKSLQQRGNISVERGRIVIHRTTP